MKKVYPALVGSCLIASAVFLTFRAQAAELAPPARSAMTAPHRHFVRYCGFRGCPWHRPRHALCPDGYSCYPLYGAYGPYGGFAYWDAYTGGGWEYR
jgi:hypothetical protein